MIVLLRAAATPVKHRCVALFNVPFIIWLLPIYFYKMKFLFTLFFLLSTIFSFSQTIDTLTGGTRISLRGLSVVNDSVVWASGSSGTVARSVDGGATFEWQSITGYETRDFRDIEAFDSATAIIMAIAEPAVILKTTNGGKTWVPVFTDSTKGMFLDAMDFIGSNGVVIGDPINGQMFLATTTDSGSHWQTVNSGVPLAEGEAFFASSGTNIQLLPSPADTISYVAASGGLQSHFIHNGKVQLPLLQGKESQGANSIAVHMNRFVVTGGDFANKEDTTGNCALSTDGGKTWQAPHTSPHGYRSCVVFLTDTKLIACGTSGVDISDDGGMNWKNISGESYHVCGKAKKGTAVFLAGSNGRIAKLK